MVLEMFHTTVYIHTYTVDRKFLLMYMYDIQAVYLCGSPSKRQLMPNTFPTDLDNPAENNKGSLNGEGEDDEGSLMIDEGADVVGGLVPPELVDIAVALNEDRV